MTDRLQRKKVLALFSVLVFVLGISNLAHATNEDIEYVQAAAEESEQQLASTQERIAALEESKTSSESYLTELAAQMSELTGELEETSSRLEEKENELEQIRIEIDRLEAEEADQYEAMKIRIQFLYENGTTAGTFVSMLSSDSFTEFLNRAENYSAINRYDREMLESYVNTLDTIKDKQAALLEEKEEILKIKDSLSERQKQIQELYNSAYNDMVSYLAQIDDAQNEQLAIIEELQAQEALMNELLRQQYEAEAAAALAAEQAAQEALDAENIPEEFYEEETSDPGQYEEEQPAPPEEPQDYSEDVPESEPSEPEQEQIPDTGSEEGQPEEQNDAEVIEEETPAEESTGNMTYLGNFTLTAYCPCAQCCGAYASGYTASGTYATAGRTVAMGGVEFGTQLYINGQIYTVEDRGTAYGHVDIFFDSHDQALAFGMQYADVYVVN